MAYFKNPHYVSRVSSTRPQAELLTIGNELLTGSTLNTNTKFLGRELTQLGFQVRAQSACPDEIPSIHNALELAIKRSQLIIVSGGLGPTPDDVTRESIASFFKVPLVFSKSQYQEIARHYRKRKRPVPALVKKEAYFPRGAKQVLNPYGIALGFIIENLGKIIVVLPGVPGELTRIFESQIRPYLRKKFPNLRPYASLLVKTIGFSESSIMKRLGRDFFKLGSFQFGIYPQIGEVSIRIYADSIEVIRRIKKRVIQTLGDSIYSFSEKTIQEVVAETLLRRRWTLAVAESCTGGQIAETITRIPGSSRYFQGGVVAYQNRVKVEILNVPEEVLKNHGAVSEETALRMAQGVRKKLNGTLGMAVTGIAGPGGGSTSKPVGLVYIAIASSKKTKVWKEEFVGDRVQVQDRASKRAFEYLWRWLQN